MHRDPPSEPGESPRPAASSAPLPEPGGGGDGSADTGTLKPASKAPDGGDSVPSEAAAPPVAPGEALQLVRFSRSDQTLRITGVTPHGRRLTFEQRADREGWYVVVAGRRRRPTQRELGLVVASITQEMEAAISQERQEEVRSAYRLAASSDQPGLPGRGLQAYRDLLLDEAGAFIAGQNERLGVVAIEYQAFKRFALRHGHRVGQAFVRALGERLHALFRDEEKVHVCHKAGKSFRMIVIDRSAQELLQLVHRVVSDDTRKWLAERVWGDSPRTHPDEIHFYVGIAMARPSERQEQHYLNLAQRLNDDAYRAAKLGQLRGHTSIQAAKMDYRTTVQQWVRGAEDELEDLAAEMDDGPAEVMAETVDVLNELVPADLEGMAVEGDVRALIHKAIARDGFWQGSLAMRIAAEALVARFLGERTPPEGENGYVGGFDLGDEFYGLSLEGDRLYFAWGDINSAGATRTRAGLERIRTAVGWRREDGGGIVGRFLKALAIDDGNSLLDRLRDGAQRAYDEVRNDPAMRVNDAVDMADYLWTALPPRGETVRSEHLVEGAELFLVLPDGTWTVRVLERRSNFIVRLEIGGEEHVAAVSESVHGLDLKLRVRNTVASAAICLLDMRRDELIEMLSLVREDNGIPDRQNLNVVGFLRHVADLLLAEQVKNPGKIRMALGDPWQVDRFVRSFSLEDVREDHPGLFYEAVHQELIHDAPLQLDHNLRDIVVQTMLRRTRPESS